MNLNNSTYNNWISLRVPVAFIFVDLIKKLYISLFFDGLDDFLEWANFANLIPYNKRVSDFWIFLGNIL